MRILTGVLAAGAVLAIAGCGVQVGGGATSTEDRSYDVPENGINSLSLRLNWANATIVGTDATKITVYEHLKYSKNRKPTPHHTVTGSQLNLGYSCPRGFNIGFNECSVGYRVEVPRAMAVDVRNDSAALVLVGLGGPVTAHADSGSVALSDFRGPSATLSADSGTVRIDGATGNPTLRLNADSGTIRADGIQGGKLTASVDSGSLRAAFTAPPSLVDTTTDSGSTHLNLPTTVGYDIQLTVDSGGKSIDPAIRQQSDSSYKIKARADSGSVAVDPA